MLLHDNHKKMSIILNIETSTDICSVSISVDGECIALKISDNDRSHSKILASFIQDVLRESNFKPKDINALALSSGPGSYTGLRIGASTAKGFCYGADIPLIAVNTMQIIAKMALLQKTDLDNNCVIIPMIDARRMEVYAAGFNDNLDVVFDTKAEIITEGSFSEYKNKKLIFCGNGIEKCKQILSSDNSHFLKDIYPSAENMGYFSNKLYTKSVFENVVTFEPFYLKDFIATTPKNKVLNIKNK